MSAQYYCYLWVEKDLRVEKAPSCPWRILLMSRLFIDWLLLQRCRLSLGLSAVSEHNLGLGSREEEGTAGRIIPQKGMPRYKAYRLFKSGFRVVGGQRDTPSVVYNGHLKF